VDQVFDQGALAQCSGNVDDDAEGVHREVNWRPNLALLDTEEPVDEERGCGPDRCQRGPELNPVQEPSGGDVQLLDCLAQLRSDVIDRDGDPGGNWSTSSPNDSRRRPGTSGRDLVRVVGSRKRRWSRVGVRTPMALLHTTLRAQDARRRRRRSTVVARGTPRRLVRMIEQFLMGAE
jgi:hypothetical protein